ncbi:MAG: LLM class F420-dependent oxidoreductase [Polyangiales bacterium]
MKIGIIPINVGVRDAERMAAVARKAEEVGVESVWTFEHVIVPMAYDSKYPYSAEGKMAASPETVFVDPLIALSFVAGCTRTLRLGTGVNILPQANPLLLAKQAASIDFVSGGRLLLGVGTGWLREEYEALGTPFERRGARFDDYVTAMKKVWSGEVVEHEGEFVKLHGFKSHPVPVQKPHPPLIIGGTSRAALMRVARHGDGWFAPSAGVAALAPQLAELRAIASELGRKPESIEITAMWPFALEGVASIARYEALGVSRLVAPVQLLGARNPLDGLDKLGEQLARARA